MTVKVNDGDRVRIILEGEAWNAETWLGSKSVSIGRNGDGSNTIKLNAEHVVSVEVLAKQFKVGDMVGGDDYAKLPVGTLVGSGRTVELFKASPNCWVDKNASYADDNLRAGRTIAYLPDAS